MSRRFFQQPYPGAAHAVVLAFSLLLPTWAQAQGTFFVEGDKVGIGTPTPVTTLEVQRSDGTAKLLVQELTGAVADRSLFELRNNGGVSFFFNNTAGGSNWQMSNLSNSFVVSKIGTGGPELLVSGTGAVIIGPGGTQNFVLDSLGNLTIQGSLSQGSSRDFKDHFTSLDPQLILERVSKLPISMWNYRSEGPEIRHIGPVAEDFYQVFGLGPDDKHLAPSDKAGVALVAIQGLYQRLEEKQNEVASLAQQQEDLKRQNEELKARLAAIEMLLENIPPTELQPSAAP